MGGCTRSFKETKFRSFLIKGNELLKNIVISGIKSAIHLKMDLAVKL